MYIAWNELRFARGRFVLMGAVIGLITLLVVLLSGLTAGLAGESVSAVRSLPGTHLAFGSPAAGQGVAFSDSTVDAQALQVWREAPGVASASALGVAPTRIRTDDVRLAVSAFGVDPDGVLAPRPSTGVGLTDTGGVVLSAAAAEALAVGPGARVSVGAHSMAVAGIAGDASFDHLPVAWFSLADWGALDTGSRADAVSAAASTESTESTDRASVIVLDLDPGVAVDALDAAAGTSTRTIADSYSAVGSFEAENGSLSLIRLLLLAVSALVVGAFFTVWTVQRRHDLAVLKAIGASSRYLVKDALAQALAVLLAGGIAGTAVAAALGTIAARTVPFVVEPGTTVLPLLFMVAVGMVGAAVAVRQVTSVDPLQALGAAR